MVKKINKPDSTQQGGEISEGEEIKQNKPNEIIETLGGNIQVTINSKLNEKLGGPIVFQGRIHTAGEPAALKLSPTEFYKQWLEKLSYPHHEVELLNADQLFSQSKKIDPAFDYTPKIHIHKNEDGKEFMCYVAHLKDRAAASLMFKAFCVWTVYSLIHQESFIKLFRDFENNDRNHQGFIRFMDEDYEITINQVSEEQENNQLLNPTTVDLVKLLLNEKIEFLHSCLAPWDIPTELPKELSAYAEAFTIFKQSVQGCTDGFDDQYIKALSLFRDILLDQ